MVYETKMENQGHTMQGLIWNMAVTIIITLQAHLPCKPTCYKMYQTGYGTCVQALVAESLKAVGLSGVEPLFPGELSGGMKKRVALARAIIRDSEHDHAEQVLKCCLSQAPAICICTGELPDLLCHLSLMYCMSINVCQGCSCPA